MSNSFFASVRRNQKQWMVVVTVLAMVSFLFMDSFSDRHGPMSPLGGGVLIGVLCAAGMCIIGYPRGMTTEFGLGGLVVGFLAGYLGFGAIGMNKPLVRTSVGNFSRQDLNALSIQRQKLNQFVSSVGRKMNQQQVPLFGNADDDSILSLQVLLGDARKMGIQISDDRVNSFLKDLTQGRLSKSDYKECLRESHLTESQLFDSLKDELSAQLVIALMQPPSYTPPIPPQFASLIQRPSSYLPPTPYELWSDYQKLTLKESLQAVALPVKDFVSKVGEPSESEVANFYKQHLNSFWVDEARPGFTTPARVQLAYVTGDLEKFEKVVANPTDEEVADYYQLNKQRYRIFSDNPPASEPPKTEAESKDAPKSDEPAAPKTDDANKPPAAETEEKKPAANDVKEPPADKPAEEPKKDEGKAEEKKPEADPKSNCDEQPSDKKPEEADKPKAEQAETKDKPADPTPAADAPKSDEAPKPPADGEKPKSETAEEASKSDPSNTTPGLPALSDSPSALPAPKYRELDEELKLEIRETLIKEKAFDKVVAELDKAKELMDKLSLEYDSTVEAAKKEEKAKVVAEKLKEFATARNLEYKETELLSYDDLSGEPIGTAIEGRGRSPVAVEVFIQIDNGQPRMPLYYPRRADLKESNQAFAYWKIAEVPAEPGDLKSDAVREKVIAAWKFDRARLLAENRAKDLVEKVKTTGNDLPAALATESITGDKDAPPIAVIPTEEFTWLRANSSVPGAGQAPTISVIPLIDDIGDKFMKTVFEDLKDGDVGMVFDDNRSTVYIVRVMNRETGKNDEGGVVKHERQQRFLKEKFTSAFFPLTRSPYEALAENEQRMIEQSWQRNFQQQHDVEWDQNQLPNRSRRTRR